MVSWKLGPRSPPVRAIGLVSLTTVALESGNQILNAILLINSVRHLRKVCQDFLRTAVLLEQKPLQFYILYMGVFWKTSNEKRAISPIFTQDSFFGFFVFLFQLSTRQHKLIITHMLFGKTDLYMSILESLAFNCTFFSTLSQAISLATAKRSLSAMNMRGSGH